MRDNRPLDDWTGWYVAANVDPDGSNFDVQSIPCDGPPPDGDCENPAL
jgi:hypothetical protein